MNLKSILKKNQLCRYLIYCIHGIKDKNIREKILDAIENPRNLNIICKGKKNPGKIIYYIRISAKSGFCVLYKNVLELIYFADRLGFIPVVEFTKDILYSEEELFLNTNNAFEYYFRQPDEVSLETALQSENVIFSKMSDLKVFTGELGYELNEDQLHELAKIHRKYISLRKELEDEFSKEFELIFNGINVLGIHVRGTDFAKNYKNHPQFVPTNDYLQKAIELWRTGKYEKIFLATDDEKSLNLFKNEFGDNLIFFADIYRTFDGTAVHLTKHKRLNDRYLLGKEVLKDVFALSKCNALIAGRSNVSMIARILNFANEKKYIDCCILDYGLNKNGKILRVKKI